MPGVWERFNGTEWVGQDSPLGRLPSAAEFRYWQTKAVLLDPLAYELLSGSGATATVPAGETWFLVDGWQVDIGTPTLFHRKPDVLNGNYIPMKSGETITLEANAGAHALICKPALVVDSDSRYTDDPRGLFYERLYRLDHELATFNVGHNDTGSTVIASPFPTDFTYGMVVHVSAHDVSWVGLQHSSTAFTLNLNNEISDSDRLRFSERMTVPFTRAVFPNVSSRGASFASGTGNVRYVKLPADW